MRKNAVNARSKKVHTSSPKFVPESNEDIEGTNSIDEVIESRKHFYGDPYISHEAIGLAFEAVLRNRYHDLFDAFPQPGSLIPPDLCAQMLAIFKVVRGARPIFKADSNIDAQAYLKFNIEFNTDPSR